MGTKALLKPDSVNKDMVLLINLLNQKSKGLFYLNWVHLAYKIAGIRHQFFWLFFSPFNMVIMHNQPVSYQSQHQIIPLKVENLKTLLIITNDVYKNQERYLHHIFLCDYVLIFYYDTK